MIAFTGPPAGTEGLAAFAGLFGVGAALLAFLGIRKLRTFVTVAVTSSGVVVFNNTSRSLPATLAARFRPEGP